jgi:hypothetical protein
MGLLFDIKAWKKNFFTIFFFSCGRKRMLHSHKRISLSAKPEHLFAAAVSLLPYYYLPELAFPAMRGVIFHIMSFVSHLPRDC